MTNETDRHAIGANNPPTDPIGAIDDLYIEAQNWLDGAAIETSAHVAEVNRLIDLIAAARKMADAARKLENAPFDTGKAAVQARYNPALKKADDAITAARAALLPWMQKQRAEQDRIAAEARKKADDERIAAIAAFRAADAGNLLEREQAEEKLKAAKRAEYEAAQAAKAKPQVKGDGRTKALKTTYKPVLVDISAAAGHYYKTQRSRMADFLCQLAAEDVRAGKREIPGFTIEKVESVL